MITHITIKNFKSIIELPLSLSRINVFIGENGAGKSNILEAIALAGAAAADKLDHEFLSSRGIRVTPAEVMRPAFLGCDANAEVSVTVKNNQDESKDFVLDNDNQPYAKWKLKKENEEVSNLKETNQQDKIKKFSPEERYEIISSFKKILDNTEKLPQNQKDEWTTLINIIERDFINLKSNSSLHKHIENFIIYSPENSALRTFQREGQIQPLGINGEGLLKFISVLSNNPDKSCISDIKSSLKLLDWFEDFNLIEDAIPYPTQMRVKDGYIDNDKVFLDQLSTNEGFLFLLFYFAALSSTLTPAFFAIDNIDASLNPKLCEGLLKKLVLLAKQHDKQIILTTHNPATLDGLNLEDDEQRLFVVARGRDGQTKVSRIEKPKPKAGKHPARLSELFIKGQLGSLSKDF